MIKYFRLMLLLLLVGTISSQTIAAPAFDTGNQAQTTAIADNDYGIAPVLFFVTTEPARFLPGIVFTASNNNNKSGNFQGLALRQQNVNSNQNWCATVTCSMKFLLTQGYSANLTNDATWTWTATYDDDDGANQNFFFLNTSGFFGQTSAQPEFNLLC